VAPLEMLGIAGGGALFNRLECIWYDPSAEVVASSWAGTPATSA
jgi:hypothetical protein